MENIKMSRPNFKDRIVGSIPAFGEMVESQGILGFQMVSGAIAGDLAVSKIKADDRLVGVADIAGVDLTDEFSITKDGVINNTGGTSSAASFVMVIFEQWDER